MKPQAPVASRAASRSPRGLLLRRGIQHRRTRDGPSAPRAPHHASYQRVRALREPGADGSPLTSRRLLRVTRLFRLFRSFPRARARAPAHDEVRQVDARPRHQFPSRYDTRARSVLVLDAALPTPARVGVRKVLRKPRTPRRRREPAPLESPRGSRAEVHQRQQQRLRPAARGDDREPMIVGRREGPARATDDDEGTPGEGGNGIGIEGPFFVKIARDSSRRSPPSAELLRSRGADGVFHRRLNRSIGRRRTRVSTAFLREPRRFPGIAASSAPMHPRLRL